MLAPYSMLTTKNWDCPMPRPGVVLLLMLAFSGCAPSGPRLLREGERLIQQQNYPRAIDRLKIASQLLSATLHGWNHLGLPLPRAGPAKEAARAHQLPFPRN